eukprot:795627_1
MLSCKGVILSLFGSGNAPQRQTFNDILNTAYEEYDCEIVITCQSFKGGVDTSLYKRDCNWITAGDMTTECCVRCMGNRTQFKCEIAEQSGQISELNGTIMRK